MCNHDGVPAARLTTRWSWEREECDMRDINWLLFTKVNLTFVSHHKSASPFYLVLFKEK